MSNLRKKKQRKVFPLAAADASSKQIFEITTKQHTFYSSSYYYYHWKMCTIFKYYTGTCLFCLFHKFHKTFYNYMPSYSAFNIDNIFFYCLFPSFLLPLNRYLVAENWWFLTRLCELVGKVPIRNIPSSLWKIITFRSD